MPGRTLAIAAHPGDAIFTMGAAVARQVHDGGAGAFLNLTLGEMGHPTIPPPEYGAMQRAATEEAARMLGADSFFLAYPDAGLPFSEGAVLAVCDMVREYRPDIVLTHWEGSWHKDHRNAFAIVRDAVFYAGLPATVRALPAHPVKRIYYAENWEDARGFEPDTLLDIGPVFECWKKACEAFPMWRGETGIIRYRDYYTSLAVLRGALAQFDHAIALMSDPDARTRRLTKLDDAL
jgi:LmbE family N-acetylglucosaminyl deacetylase